VLFERVARALDGSRLELIILPTEKCNFRCEYCYEDFLIGRMKETVLTGIKNLLSKRVPELNSLHISWFGGEPLLAVNLMLTVNRFSLDLAQKYNVTFESGITTNGWALDQRCFDDLIEHNVFYYQITLDGPQRVHDLTRKMANGSGTYARIFDNLKMMKRSGHRFRVTLRLHLTPSNFDINKTFAKELAAEFGFDTRFEIFPHTIRKLGGSNDSILELFSAKESAPREKEISEVFYAASGRAAPSTEASYICYAAKANSFIIRPDGRIGKCTVDLYNDRNTVGYLKENGIIEMDNRKLGRWVRGLTSLNPEALSCPLSRIEAG
jgi:uncharacterized protein